VNQGSHNSSDMKNNHMPNLTHGKKKKGKFKYDCILIIILGQIQMVSTHIPQRQQAAVSIVIIFYYKLVNNNCIIKISF
jgi:hypothetical protein